MLKLLAELLQPWFLELRQHFQLTDSFVVISSTSFRTYNQTWMDRKVPLQAQSYTCPILRIWNSSLECSRINLTFTRHACYKSWLRLWRIWLTCLNYFVAKVQVHIRPWKYRKHSWWSVWLRNIFLVIIGSDPWGLWVSLYFRLTKETWWFVQATAHPNSNLWAQVSLMLHQLASNSW